MMIKLVPVTLNQAFIVTRARILLRMNITNSFTREKILLWRVKIFPQLSKKILAHPVVVVVLILINIFLMRVCTQTPIRARPPWMKPGTDTLGKAWKTTPKFNAKVDGVITILIATTLGFKNTCHGLH